MAFPPQTIGFIGGTGRMGQIFRRLFERDGYTVLVVGRRTELSYEALAERADVVIVTVPIPHVAGVVARIAPALREDQLLSDLTSIKAAPVAAMLATRAAVIGCHPVFGPVPDLTGQNVVLCPARPGPFLDWYRDWFQGHAMRVEVMTAEAHDEAMGIVQGLTHFTQLAFAHTLRTGGADIEDLMRVSSPVHRILFALMARILSGDAELYGAIQRENPASARWVGAFLDAAREVREVLDAGDTEAFAELYRAAGAHLGAARARGQAESERLVATLRDDEHPPEPHARPRANPADI